MIKLNPDKEFVKDFKEKLKENNLKQQQNQIYSSDQ